MCILEPRHKKEILSGLHYSKLPSYGRNRYVYPQYRLFVGKMNRVDLDERGRLTLPSGLRKKMNNVKQVVLIESGDHIKIIPIPEDPFSILEGALSLHKQTKELREEVEKQALREVKKRTNR